MRRIFLLILFGHLLSGHAWTQTGTLPAGNTYAVIVGISTYQEGIGKLDFAHRDAEEFDKFLRSKAGGSVPGDNIRLLLNNGATYSAIYNALYWLLDTCEKNDLVYFYFSGHGDVENRTVAKEGYLLAANSPRFNYLHNAISIEKLNSIANTLSVTNGAKVILITDACHSGKLAGNESRGNFLAAEQLRIVRGNEIRITSCGPDQLSNEDERWGGGRGVFSYYLVKGLEGLADSSKDQAVTLEEIKHYLNRALAADRILAAKEHKQVPVVTGSPQTRLSTVSPLMATAMAQESDAGMPAVETMASLAPLGVSPQGYLFGLIGWRKLEEVADFNVLSKLAADHIPFAFIDMLSRSLSKMDETDTIKIEKLRSSLRNNKDALRRFNDKLVELMADRGQEVINLYLEGDEAELEKRRYYNSLSNGYDIYVKMFATALKLVAPQNELYKILRVKYHYFAGITARLKIPLTENPIRLLDTAMREQQAAFKLQENAAYIHNELGILFRYKKDNITAEKHFLRATQIAPTWALPWSNLSGLYSSNDAVEKGMEAVEKARKLQPKLQAAFLNKGILFEKKGNLLLAEEHFRKSIRINTRHYLPFERMGYVCMNTTRYAEADSNFLEADKRKRGYRFHFSEVDAQGVADNMEIMSPIAPCKFDTSTVAKDDVIGHFYIGLLYVGEHKFDKAESKFKQVIRIDPSNPLAFHHLGKLLFDQQRWKEADIILSYAVQYHLDTAGFRQYCDSLRRKFPRYAAGEGPDTAGVGYNCVFNRFKSSWVPKMESRFYLGTVYEKWNHFEEAEQQFRSIIREEPNQTGAYYKLWNLLENIGRYTDAEAAVRLYPEPMTVDQELVALYRRIIARHPLRAEWYYKAGLLMYNMFVAAPDRYTHDRKQFMADSEVETYRDKVYYAEQGFLDYHIPGTGETYKLYGENSFPLTDGIGFLRKADSLITEEETLAEVNFKIGDLYVWQGLPQRADAYYRRSFDLHPDDANTRLKYIYTTITNYNYELALEQLDSLNKRREINYPAQVMLARYCIHAGRFAEAGPLLNEAKAIHPYRQDDLTDLEGRLQLLAGKPLLALPYYKEYLSRHPGDAGTSYTIARIYAKSNNSTEAWKWLTQAINKGFDHYWVLKYDDSWNSYRSNRKWTDLTKNIRSKE